MCEKKYKLLTIGITRVTNIVKKIIFFVELWHAS